jgi:hypothetical protein
MLRIPRRVQAVVTLRVEAQATAEPHLALELIAGNALDQPALRLLRPAAELGER